MEEFSLFSSNSSNTPTISYISSNWKRGVVDKENKVRESLAYYKDLSMTKLVGICQQFSKSRKENPQKLTQLSSRSHPRHLVGKRTAEKDITIDSTSDSQVNSNFPNRWSSASVAFNNYFYLFLYLYMT